ncbi:MAG: MaoC family dehydratase [Albidovulum sp.]|nr:MaoC family dehydratase [Albidovulum sp.]
MSEFHVEIGEGATFSKTVSESDVYMFAGITGDFSPNHVNETFMRNSSFGKRMAHGALLVGYMSTASTLAISHTRFSDETAVSAGYDRVRFIRPVFLGDTVTVHYEIENLVPERRRSIADIRVTNQNGDIVAAAKHILQWVPNES